MRNLIMGLFFLSWAVTVNALPFTITKLSGNPILVDSGSGQDAGGVRDACFVKTSDGTFNIVYTGFSGPTPGNYWAEGMLATSPTFGGTQTKHGTIFQLSVSGVDLTSGSNDLFVLFDGTTWHAWSSIIPSGLSDKNSRRQIGHLIATGTATVVPTSGWTYENIAAVVGKTTGWTSTGAGAIAGVAAGKVYPATGGGWIMYLAGWGYSAASKYQVGYATASSLYGPWTLNDTPLFGTPGGYQAEQITYLHANGKHYLFCNRLGLNGQDTGWPTLGIDLWQADNQTGPYTLAQYDIIPHGGSGAWDGPGGDMGVTGLAGYDLDAAGTIQGIYDANSIGGASIDRSIGGITITATYIISHYKKADGAPAGIVKKADGSPAGIIKKADGSSL